MVSNAIGRTPKIPIDASASRTHRVQRTGRLSLFERESQCAYRPISVSWSILRSSNGNRNRECSTLRQEALRPPLPITCDRHKTLPCRVAARHCGCRRAKSASSLTCAEIIESPLRSSSRQWAKQFRSQGGEVMHQFGVAPATLVLTEFCEVRS